MARRYFILLFILILTGSCNNIPEKYLPSFQVNIPAINLRVPPLPIVSDREVPVGALRTRINMDSTIKANTAGAFGATSVRSVKVKSITLKSANADEANNLSNFETARIRIFTDTSFVDIATISFPAGYTDSLVVVPTSTPDISRFLKGSTLAYNLYWKNRRPTMKPLRLQINIALNVQ